MPGRRQSESRRAVTEALGQRIRAALAEKEKGISDLQHAAGVSWPSAQAWVQGRSYPGGEHLRAIAEVLGMTVEQLVGIARGEDPPHEAWRAFIDSHGNELTPDERDALAMITWPKEPKFSSYVLALAALRA
jgi:transcriptional regulator with XRE-family HTH domain